MGDKKLIAICQSGGEFVTNRDGTLKYNGGEAYAIDIDNETQFDNFRMELAEMYNYSPATMTVKYFLPGNRKTLITISNDKDLKRMISFHQETATADVYIITRELVAHDDVSNMPCSRSSRTTISEAVVPGDDTPIDGIIDNPVDALVDVPVDSTLVGCANTLDFAKHHTPLALENSVNDDGTSAPFPHGGAIVPNGAKHHKALAWENLITGVDQRFNSVHEFREALKKYSIAHGFAYKFKKNDSHRVTVRCKNEGCPWRLHASKLSTTQLFCIKKMSPTHTCEGTILPCGYQATTNWVADVIKERLRDSPNYKPKDIVIDIKRDYGIELNYSQAWRAKEIAREQLRGSYKEAYSHLPFLCEKIMETNPGSFASFNTKEDSSFHRIFVSFHASLHGFQHGCRPLLFLDSTPLNSKYQGTLLAATSADGDDGVFPVAFAIVDTETDDNWKWFLEELKSAVSTSRRITFVADRQKGLKESIALTFENAYHGYCLRYLTEQFKKDLNTQFSNEVKRLLVEDLKAAANAPQREGFQRSIDSIKGISQEAFNWVLQSEPAHWANAFFQGARYNHMSSNFGEMFYRWVSEAHELPITQMVDVIRGKMTDLFYARRADSSQWSTRLTPSMDQKLQREALKARSLEVTFRPNKDSTFDVCGESSFQNIDVNHWHCCSCKGWSLTGLPCCHAIAVFQFTGRNLDDYCNQFFFFTTEYYRMTYSQSINPVPNVDISTGKKETSQMAVVVTPPPTRRTPGRPKSQRSGIHDLDKRKLQCSRCKGIGHNKSTCKEAV